MQHAYHRSHSDEHSQNQADSDEQFHHADQISKEDNVRKDDVAQHRSVEADCSLLNKPFEVVRESGARELTAKYFVLTKDDEEDSDTDPGNQ